MRKLPDSSYSVVVKTDVNGKEQLIASMDLVLHKSDSERLQNTHHDLREDRNAFKQILTLLKNGPSELQIGLIISSLEKTIQSLSPELSRLEMLYTKAIRTFETPQISEPIQSEAPFELENQAVDCILIDDDPLMEPIWQTLGALAGKSVQYFKSIPDFKASVSEINRNIPLYIDSNLGEGERGENFAEELFHLGFSEIHLCTGQLPETFPSLPFIKSIRGKEPPWKVD